mgnify:CR=1 FL=1
MKLTDVNDWLFCLSSVVASTYAQTATLNVSAKNETLEKVLKQIEKQSEFLFFYNLEEINKNRKDLYTMKRMLIFRLCWMLLQLKQV